MQTFDLTRALPAHTDSLHTQRAYYRWVDRYLVEVAQMKKVPPHDRPDRLRRLPIKTVARALTARRFTRWLNDHADAGMVRASLDQARAAIVTLAELLAQAKIITHAHASEIRAVSVPPVQRKETPERLLSTYDLRLVMSAARQIATSPPQRARNDVIATMLCTIALRREELSALCWDDLIPDERGLLLQTDASESIVLPPSVVSVINAWRHHVTRICPDIVTDSPVIRRIWKGGRIAEGGLSPDGIWLTIRRASAHAGLGEVTPDDLRRSAVAGMRSAGIPVQDISRLLRHRNQRITERFLARLPDPDQ